MRASIHRTLPPGLRSGASGTARTETVVGILILALLCLTAAWVFLKQSRYDPTLFRNDLAQATSTGLSPSVEETLALISTEESDDSDVLPETELPAVDLATFVPAEFKPMSQTESFDRQTLSDKINGKAELYFESGFVHLSCRRFVSSEKPDAWFEFFLYDMGSPVNAFSVFGVQRRADGRSSDVGEFAYATDNAMFLAAGRHYVELVSATAGEPTATVLNTTARNIVEVLAGEQAEMAAFALFPQQGLDRSSMRLVLKDAFSCDRLDNIACADFVVDGTTVTAFVSVRKDADEAAELADAYYQMLTRDVGADAMEPATSTTVPLRMVDLLGDTEIIFTIDNVLAGVHTAPKQTAAEALLPRLFEAIEQNRPKKDETTGKQADEPYRSPGE